MHYRTSSELHNIGSHNFTNFGEHGDMLTEVMADMLDVDLVKLADSYVGEKQRGSATLSCESEWKIEMHPAEYYVVSISGEFTAKEVG